MFLSKEAITKQLFHEFLNYKTLALAPGKPVEMKPGTLLGSAAKTDLGVLMGTIENRLNEYLGSIGSESDNKRFNELLSDLLAYKKAAYTTNNTFKDYAEAPETTAHLCSWLVFAPSIIENSVNQLNFSNEQQFVEFLSKKARTFTKSSVDKTGLYIAVTTNNHEMVDAFLCSEFDNYHLTKEHLKELLLVTTDAKTRLVLFRRSKDLIRWIDEDTELQKTCVTNFEELEALWSFLNEEQRKEFIKCTHSQLWLNLLDKDLGNQKIAKLLGAEFSLVTSKISEDPEIKTSKLIPTNLHYLSKPQQFDYLLKRVDLNSVFSLPHKEEWIELLASMGYILGKDGRLTTTRYLLPELLAGTHNSLIQELISLPVDALVIIEALKKIETYVHQPDTVKEYKEFLERIGTDVVNKEYETRFFLVNWINKLLRFLGIKPKTPLHPYLDRLVPNAQNAPLSQASGELLSIFAPINDHSKYKNTVSAYVEGKIEAFWPSIDKEDKEKIIKDPIRFETLMHALSTPQDHRATFLETLDEETLQYFNTPKGLCQLAIDTPSFRPKDEMPVLTQAMADNKITFLEDPASIVQLLAEESPALEALYPFFPGKSAHAELDNLQIQEAVLTALPKPLQKEQFNRFLKAYCTEPHHFSDLMLSVNKTNSPLAQACWSNVPDDLRAQWYAQVKHADLWSEVLTHLNFSVRLAFFEKLTSGDQGSSQLTASEFCDFLKENEKDEAVCRILWDKVPDAQWATWIKDESLPETTASFLKMIPYKQKEGFFRTLLNQEERAKLSITKNKTVDQIFPEEVKKTIATAKSVNEINAKLGSLVAGKHRTFNTEFNNLIVAIEGLDGPFKELLTTNIKAHNNTGTYLYSFFKKDPYYEYVQAINSSKTTLYKSYQQMKADPLFAFIDEKHNAKEDLLKLSKAIERTKVHLRTLAVDADTLPNDLKQAITEIEAVFGTLEKIQGMPKIAINTDHDETKDELRSAAAGL